MSAYKKWEGEKTKVKLKSVPKTDAREEMGFLDKG